MYKTPYSEYEIQPESGFFVPYFVFCSVQYFQSCDHHSLIREHDDVFPGAAENEYGDVFMRLGVFLAIHPHHLPNIQAAGEGVWVETLAGTNYLVGKPTLTEAMSFDRLPQ